MPGPWIGDSARCECHGDQSDEREQGERRPQQKSVGGIGEDLQRMRRVPEHFAHHQGRGTRKSIERLVRDQLRQVADEKRDAHQQPRHPRGTGRRSPRCAKYDTTKSTAGPSAQNMSCSRTIAISAAANPSAVIPPRLHVRRTFTQIATKIATANAEHACEKGGATYIKKGAACRTRPPSRS